MTLKTAAGWSVASIVAVIGCVIALAQFFEITPNDIRKAERDQARIVARIDWIEHRITEFPDSEQIADLAEHIESLSKQIDRLQYVLNKYGINEDNLVPGDRRPGR